MTPNTNLLSLLARLDERMEPRSFDCEANALTSGVARVPCALGQKEFLRLPVKKTTEFEVKNEYKSAEKAKAEHLL